MGDSTAPRPGTEEPSEGDPTQLAHDQMSPVSTTSTRDDVMNWRISWFSAVQHESLHHERAGYVDVLPA
jgi:hypothetical protein